MFRARHMMVTYVRGHFKNVSGSLVFDPDKGPKVRAGFVATTRINRHDFGVSWNDDLPGGGVVVSNDIPLSIDVEAILDDDLRAVGLESAVWTTDRGCVAVPMSAHRRFVHE